MEDCAAAEEVKLELEVFASEEVLLDEALAEPLVAVIEVERIFEVVEGEVDDDVEEGIADEVADEDFLLLEVDDDFWVEVTFLLVEDLLLVFDVVVVEPEFRIHTQADETRAAVSPGMGEFDLDAKAHHLQKGVG